MFAPVFFDVPSKQVAISPPETPPVAVSEISVVIRRLRAVDERYFSTVAPGWKYQTQQWVSEIQGKCRDILQRNQESMSAESCEMLNEITKHEVDMCWQDDKQFFDALRRIDAEFFVELRKGLEVAESDPSDQTLRMSLGSRHEKHSETIKAEYPKLLVRKNEAIRERFTKFARHMNTMDKLARGERVELQ